MFKQLTIGVVRINIDGSFLEMNMQFCNIIGCTNEELLIQLPI